MRVNRLKEHQRDRRGSLVFMVLDVLPVIPGRGCRIFDAGENAIGSCTVRRPCTVKGPQVVTSFQSPPGVPLLSNLVRFPPHRRMLSRAPYMGRTFSFTEPQLCNYSFDIQSLKTCIRV